MSHRDERISKIASEPRSLGQAMSPRYIYPLLCALKITITTYSTTISERQSIAKAPKNNAGRCTLLATTFEPKSPRSDLTVSPCQPAPFAQPAPSLPLRLQLVHHALPNPLPTLSLRAFPPRKLHTERRRQEKRQGLHRPPRLESPGDPRTHRLPKPEQSTAAPPNTALPTLPSLP